ncbi:hypothetical protein [Sutcliffiella cohnii]|uniref:hypothetical protein n=1 Tax=Sutcliffiella cohnii TaxID=33932 RepID=UPI002E1C18FB|nr:hypothetical protein [Sutcliffiella cohnii]
MKRLIRAIKANYEFYVDVYERIWGSGNTQYEQQKEEKKINDSKIIPFDPQRASKRNKFNNVRDVTKEYDKKNQIK